MKKANKTSHRVTVKPHSSNSNHSQPPVIGGCERSTQLFRNDRLANHFSRVLHEIHLSESYNTRSYFDLPHILR